MHKASRSSQADVSPPIRVEHRRYALSQCRGIAAVPTTLAVYLVSGLLPIAVAQSPSPGDAARQEIHEAERKLWNGRPRDAIKVFDNALSSVSLDAADRALVRVRLMEARQAEGDYEDVVAQADALLLELANRTEPDNHAAWAYLWRGRALEQQGDYAASLTALRRAIDENAPDKAIGFEAHIQIGKVHRFLGDEQAGLAAFRDAVAFAQTSGLPRREELRGWKEVAESLDALGDSELSVAYLRQVIPKITELDGGSWVAVRRIAWLLPPEQRIAWLRYVAEPQRWPDPTVEIVQRRLGESVAESSGGTLTSAWQRYRELGLHLWRLAYAADAAAAFEQAIALAETPARRAELYQRAARCHSEARNRDRAAALLADGLRSSRQVILGADDEAAKDAIEALTVAYSNAGFDKDQIHVLEALSRDPALDAFAGRRLCVIRYLARLYWSRHRNGDAIRICQQALTDYDNAVINEKAFVDEPGKLRRRLAILHLFSGDLDAANACLEQLNPENCSDKPWRHWAKGEYAKYRQVFDAEGDAVAARTSHSRTLR